MIPSLIPLVVALFLPVSQETVTFGNQKPAVGDTMTTDLDFDFKMEIKVSLAGQVMQEFDQSNRRSLKTTSKVTNTGDSGVDKIEFVLNEYKEEQKNPMTGPSSEENPAKGKTFIVEKAADTMEVKNSDGKPASAEEQKGVTKVLGDAIYDPTHAMSEAVSGEIKVGEAKPLEADIARKVLFDTDGQMNVEEATLTLKEVKTIDGVECGVFALGIGVKNEEQQGPMKIAMTLKAEGEVVVQVKTGWVQSLTISAPTNIKNAGDPNPQAPVMDGSGMTKITAKHAYGK